MLLLRLPSCRPSSTELRTGLSVPIRWSSVGTRHRSAYRLCKELPDVLTVVVSKDDDVRFVRQLEGGEVANWDQDRESRVALLPPLGDGLNGVGLTRKHVTQGCEDSLRRLGTD